MLRALHELCTRRGTVSAVHYIEGCPYVFHCRGQCISDFRKAWNKAIAEAGYNGRVFLALRRSGVRAMIRAGLHGDVAMKISGHKMHSVFSRYNISSENDVLLALQKTRKYRLQNVSQSSKSTTKHLPE